jgi:hypothetical protein
MHGGIPAALAFHRLEANVKTEAQLRADNTVRAAARATLLTFKDPSY